MKLLENSHLTSLHKAGRSLISPSGKVYTKGRSDQVYCAERRLLEAVGLPIGPYDLLIAGQAKQRKLTLITANYREFARVEGLSWQDWAGQD